MMGYAVGGLYMFIALIKLIRGINTSQTDKNTTERTTEPLNHIAVQEDKPQTRTPEVNEDKDSYFDRYTGGTDFYTAMTKKEVK